jgi:toxin-antitoxin system, antitoxin component, xre family
MIRGVLNRLKATLSVANQIDKWLFVPLGKVPVTISKWGRNTTQSDLLTLSRISD